MTQQMSWKPHLKIFFWISLLRYKIILWIYRCVSIKNRQVKNTIFQEKQKTIYFLIPLTKWSKKHYTDKNIIAVTHKVAKKCLYLYFLIYVTSIFMQSESKYDNYTIFHNRHKLDFQVRISTKHLVEFLHSKMW